MGTFYFKAKDGKEIFVREWSDVENPKGIIQISHGMVEHSGRYEIFANEMNKRVYIVFSDDSGGTTFTPTTRPPKKQTRVRSTRANTLTRTCDV